MPKISIILPVFNMAQYLPACLDKLLQQSVKELEIVCVNDGSTDSSLEILQTYSERDSRIKVVNQTNQGPGPARNIGIKLAVGEFLAFMDADDFFHDDAVLEKLYELARQHDVKICGGGIKIITQKNAANGEITEISFERFAAYGLTNYINFQRSTGFYRYIYKRQFIIDNNLFFPALRRGEDYIWFIKVQVAAKKFYAADVIMYVYRQNHKSSTYPYHVMLEMLESELLAMRLADENNLEKIKQYHETRLLKHTREMLLSHSATGEISAHYTRSFFRYYCLKFLARLLPGKLGRLYRDKFLAYKTPFNTVRRNRLY